jgi:hypothetical protein
MAADGTSEMIGVFPAQPIYKDLEQLVSEVSILECYPYVGSCFC